MRLHGIPSSEVFADQIATLRADAASALRDHDEARAKLLSDMADVLDIPALMVNTEAVSMLKKVFEK